MAIIPASSTPIADTGAVPLPLYAQIVNVPECKIYGVNNPNDEIYGCQNIWLKPERDMIIRQLAEAQYEIEQELRFPLQPTWFVDEEQPYAFPLNADWERFIEAGIRATSTISAGEAVDHTSDPAVIGPVATTVTDEDEIKIFYPATETSEEIEIHPSAISLSGGSVTIYVPRCRMVRVAFMDNDEAGVDYTDTTLFLQTVDVKRVYNDASTNATLVYPNRSSCNCMQTCCPVCSNYTRDGCLTARNSRHSILAVIPASYSSGSWTTSTCCERPDFVKLNYRAGLTTTPQQAIDAIIRLAHSKMPEEPCGCKVVTQAWERDRNVPTPVITRERLNCPFGLSDGAWIAWRFTQSMREVGVGVL